MLPSWSRDRLKSLTLRKWGISTPNGKRLESPLTRWWVTENENVERRWDYTLLDSSEYLSRVNHLVSRSNYNNCFDFRRINFFLRLPRSLNRESFERIGRKLFSKRHLHRLFSLPLLLFLFSFSIRSASQLLEIFQIFPS